MARLSGRVAIVTGAAQGLGATFARALAGAGAKLILCDVLDPQPCVGTIRAGGGEAAGVVTDVTDAQEVATMVALTLATYGRIDILVNNAALAAALRPQPFEQIPPSEWDMVMAVNVRGAFQCAAAVAPVMRAQKSGKIINVSSGMVFKGSAGMLHYLTSKGAVLAMTRGLARELGSDGIAVNALAPGITASEGLVATPAWDRMNAPNVASRAFQRVEQPEDLIGALLFLASSDSDFVTGQCLVVDGGSAMH